MPCRSSGRGRSTEFAGGAPCPSWCSLSRCRSPKSRRRVAAATSPTRQTRRHRTPPASQAWTACSCPRPQRRATGRAARGHRTHRPWHPRPRPDRRATIPPSRTPSPPSSSPEDGSAIPGWNLTPFTASTLQIHRRAIGPVSKLMIREGGQFVRAIFAESHHFDPSDVRSAFGRGDCRAARLLYINLEGSSHEFQPGGDPGQSRGRIARRDAWVRRGIREVSRNFFEFSPTRACIPLDESLENTTNSYHSVREANEADLPPR